VSVHKRLPTFLTLAVAAVIASATVSEAQGYHHGHVVVGAYYGYPFAYGAPWYGYQYPWPPYGMGYYGYPEASVRIEVTPRDAEVYIDGYYAGTVNDFDGTFQRLRVEPGEHEIEVFKEGFHAFRQKVYLAPDNTFKIKQALAPLAPGDQPETRPQPPAPPRGAMQGGPQTQPAPGMPQTRRPPPPPPSGSEPRGNQPPEPRGGQTASGYGTAAIRVQPADVEVSVDGEIWRGPGGPDRLMIELAAGSHTVEIRKPGFRTYVTQVEVRRGETATLNVSLRSEP